MPSTPSESLRLRFLVFFSFTLVALSDPRPLSYPRAVIFLPNSLASRLLALFRLSLLHHPASDSVLVLHSRSSPPFLARLLARSLSFSLTSQLRLSSLVP